jgi:hypothetical protein
MFIQIVYQHEGDLVFSRPLSDILASLPLLHFEQVFIVN